MTQKKQPTPIAVEKKRLLLFENLYHKVITLLLRKILLLLKNLQRQRFSLIFTGIAFSLVIHS